MSNTPNHSQSPDFWNRQQADPGGYPTDPVETPESSHLAVQHSQRLAITAFILAGIGLLLIVPFPPLGAILALIGVFVGFRAMRQNKGNKTALAALIVSGAVAVLNLIVLVTWIDAISQIFQGL